MNVKECRKRLQELLATLDKLPDNTQINTVSVSCHSNSEILLIDDLTSLASAYQLDVTKRNGDSEFGNWFEETALLGDIVLSCLKIQSAAEAKENASDRN